MVLKALAGGFSFAHFAGLGRSSKKGAAAEDLRDQHDEEAAASAAAAEADECEEEESEEGAVAADSAKAGKKGKKSGKKSEDEEDDDETSEGEDDGDDEDEDQDEEAEDEGKGKGKKAAAAQPAKVAAKPAVKSGAGDFKRGRKAERRRIGLILSNPAAAANLPFACKLACNTGMSSSAAIALLEQTPAVPTARGGRLDRQMADSKLPELKAGAPEAPKGEAAISASWDFAMKDFIPSK